MRLLPQKISKNKYCVLAGSLPPHAAN